MRSYCTHFCPGALRSSAGGQALPILNALVERLQAHTGVILFFRYNHKGKNIKRRYGLVRHVKIDFCIFGTVQACTGKNFTGKTEKNLQEKRQEK